MPMLAFSFSITMCISFVYAAPSAVTIDTHTVGNATFTFGDVITPSEENPLFFHFSSNDSLSYNCRIVKIDQDLLDKLNAAPTEAALKQIALVGTEISNGNCGSGNESSVTYAQSFSNGIYVFQVIGADTDGIGTKTPFAFEVLGGAALLEGGAGAGGVPITDVNHFWTQCQNLHTPTERNLDQIQYKIWGIADIAGLNFNSNNLDLIVDTNKLTDTISGNFSSANTVDFTIKNTDTECLYNLPEKTGQPLVPGPTTAFSPQTLASWNPPVPNCAGFTEYKREITYPFKVSSILTELKNTNSTNVELQIIVDNTPKPAPEHSGIGVTGKLILDGKKQINLEVDGEPLVKCSGKTTVG